MLGPSPQPKNRLVAVALAFSGVALPISGLHKFYLGQRWWGLLYVLLSWTPIPRIASAIEGVWYLTQDRQEFDRNFNDALPGTWAGNPVAPPPEEPGPDPARVGAIAEALRHLDSLRQEGLISEYEFEEKRRKLLDRMT